MMPCFHMKKPFIGTPPDCLQCSKQSRKNGTVRCTPEKTEQEMKLQNPSPGNTSSTQDKIIANSEALELCQTMEKNPANLVLISDYVKKNRDAKLPLPNNGNDNDFCIRFCGLDGTDYAGERFELESWEELYLPEPTKMEVLGTLESSKGMITFPQWVVLVGEDGRVYSYEDEVLHLLAYSLKELVQDGIQDTGISYDYPDDLSDEDEEVLQKDEDIQRLRQKTREFIDEDADEFNEFLKLF